MESSQLRNVILIVLRPAEGSTHFLLHPEWRKLVKPADHEYIFSLINDLEERAHWNAGNLFQQISSLNVGPLVTFESGSDLTIHPGLSQISRDFVSL